LHEILSSPQQLAYFQLYLQSIHAHENLLFIEALSELRHEQNNEYLESIVHRIWKTFFTCDSLFELNVSNKEKIEKHIQMHKWGTFSREETLEIFKEAETEV
ncbi:hypothetical protein K501DRAFT_155554, partial [Backusella circina FSU 941]